MPIQQLLGFLEIAVCVLVFCVLAVRGKWRDYWALGAFLLVRASSDAMMLVLKAMAPRLGNAAAYRIYFYTYWLSFAAESVLVVMILYALVRLMTAPLKGLQTVAGLVYSGTALVSVATSLWLCLGPHMTVSGTLVSAVSQLQRAQCLLVLCLLVFITFAMRTMGLSYRSRVFGISLGLGIMATNDLVRSTRVAIHPDTPLAYSIFNGLLFCAILAVWTIYFALPEPGRAELVADSKIQRWNEACVTYCGGLT